MQSIPLLILFLLQGLLVKRPVPGLAFQHLLPCSGLQDGTSGEESQIEPQSGTICQRTNGKWASKSQAEQTVTALRPL